MSTDSYIARQMHSDSQKLYSEVERCSFWLSGDLRLSHLHYHDRLFVLLLLLGSTDHDHKHQCEPPVHRRGLDRAEPPAHCRDEGIVIGTILHHICVEKIDK